MIPQGNSATIGALLTPSQSVAQRQAARQERYMLQSTLTQEAELQLAQEQQAVGATEQYMQSLRSLPFVGNDVRKLGQFLKGEEKGVYQRLKDVYGGSWKRWYAAEGQAWQQQTANRLQQSPFYQRAVLNRQNVDAARKAIEKGEVLVGGQMQGTNQYMPGEAMLSGFLSGKYDNFDYIGSYKPEDDLKALRETYAPDRMPWERVTVSEDEKLAHLVNQYGQQIGMDKYIRQHQNVPTFYKYDPLTKKFEFGWKAEDQAMQRERLAMEKGRYGMSMALGKQQMQLNSLKMAEKMQELTGADGTGRTFEQKAVAASDLAYQIPIKGDPKNGVLNIRQTPMYNGSESIYADRLGLSKIKDGYSTSGLRNVITPLGDTVDLSKIKGTVTAISPNLFIDGSAVDQQGRYGALPGYAQIQVKFNDPYEAEKIGLYNPNRVWGGTGPTSIFDSETKMGAGVYDPATQTATFLAPLGRIDKRADGGMFMGNLQKKIQGQKRANDDIDAPQPIIIGF